MKEASLAHKMAVSSSLPHVPLQSIPAHPVQKVRARNDNSAGRLSEMDAKTKGRAGQRDRSQVIHSYATMMQKFLSQLRHFDPQAYADKKKDIEACIAAGGKDWFNVVTRVSWAAHKMFHSTDASGGKKPARSGESVDRDNALEFSNSTDLISRKGMLGSLAGPDAKEQAKLLSEMVFGMKRYATQAYFDPEQQQAMVVEILQRLEL